MPAVQHTRTRRWATVHHLPLNHCLLLRTSRLSSLHPLYSSTSLPPIYFLPSTSLLSHLPSVSIRAHISRPQIPPSHRAMVYWCIKALASSPKLHSPLIRTTALSPHFLPGLHPDPQPAKHRPCNDVPFIRRRGAGEGPAEEGIAMSVSECHLCAHHPEMGIWERGDERTRGKDRGEVRKV